MHKIRVYGNFSREIHRHTIALHNKKKIEITEILRVHSGSIFHAENNAVNHSSPTRHVFILMQSNGEEKQST